LIIDENRDLSSRFFIEKPYIFDTINEVQVYRVNAMNEDKSVG